MQHIQSGVGQLQEWTLRVMTLNMEELDLPFALTFTLFSKSMNLKSYGHFSIPLRVSFLLFVED